jgi:ribosomal protein S18 acetylase RimI-like enzyme
MGSLGGVSIAIRELGLADKTMLEELLDVCQRDWTDHLTPGASGPMAFLTDTRTFIFGAYVDDEPAGWVWGVQIRRPDGRSMSYLHELDVVEGHRRRGIATSLMEAALNQARTAGSERLWLITHMANEPAQALYDSLGGRCLADDGELLYRWMF